MTLEGDIVLIHMENAPAFFARIESIISDVKPDWYHVKMLVLQVPLMTITWILREAYINGEEFTMGGRPVRLEKIVSPEDTERREPAAEQVPQKVEPERGEAEKPPVSSPAVTQEKGKVVSLVNRRKKGKD